MSKNQIGGENEEEGGELIYFANPNFDSIAMGETNLLNLPADVMRRIASVGHESVDMMRTVS